MHLAELNIAVPKYPLNDPRMADFMNNLQRINELGASMPGFVWIHKDDTVMPCTCRHHGQMRLQT